MRRLLGLSGGLLLVALLAPASVSTPPARAVTGATTVGVGGHRAALVIDTGTAVKRICVRFDGDSISGTELLQRAGIDPVIRSFSGEGAAICALCGVGCPADETCLTCAGATYWAYSRAPAGSSSYLVWGRGASNTRVHDGDVDAWRWSAGGSPVYVPFSGVCDGPAPASTTTTASTDGSGNAGIGNAGIGNAGVGSEPTEQSPVHPAQSSTTKNASASAKVGGTTSVPTSTITGDVGGGLSAKTLNHGTDLSDGSKRSAHQLVPLAKSTTRPSGKSSTLAAFGAIATTLSILGGGEWLRRRRLKLRSQFDS